MPAGNSHLYHRTRPSSLRGLRFTDKGLNKHAASNDRRDWREDRLPPLKVPVGSKSLCVCVCECVCACVRACLSWHMHSNAYPSVDCFKMQCLRDASGVTSNMLYSQVFYGYS